MPHNLFYCDLIIALAAQYKLPAIYVYPFDVIEGGLVSYGPDPVEPFRRAADYVDRILKGALPADLPDPSTDEVPTRD